MAIEEESFNKVSVQGKNCYQTSFRCFSLVGLGYNTHTHIQAKTHMNTHPHSHIATPLLGLSLMPVFCEASDVEYRLRRRAIISQPTTTPCSYMLIKACFHLHLVCVCVCVSVCMCMYFCACVCVGVYIEYELVHLDEEFKETVKGNHERFFNMLSLFVVWQSHT